MTILGTAMNIAGLSSGQSSRMSSSTPQFDSGNLSPFSKLLSTLQQLQQSNPSQYQQIMQQIATNLQSASQTATSQGNTPAANELTQLSKDFSQAFQTISCRTCRIWHRPSPAIIITIITSTAHLAVRTAITAIHQPTPTTRR
jgi:hypothetical protein